MMLNMLKPGEIVLFKQPHAWYEKLICYATHGPYFHCAIALDANHIIEATGNGIQVDVAPCEEDHAITYDTIDMSQYETEEHIESALSWCQTQVGKPYGWLDIAYQAIKFVAPNNPFQLTEAGHYDCSDFATRYIQHTGYPLPDSFSDPYQNTPNDIARLFGLLPMRKAVAA